MKKIILTCALLVIGLANAQIVTDAGTFTKPNEKTTIFEVNLTPDITGGGIFSLPVLNSNLGLVGIRVRDFVNNGAWRYGANLSIADNNEPNTDTEFAVALSVGYEKHRAGAERLSTYWGYEGNVGVVHANDGYGGQDKKLGVGASLFTGFDYYIMPKIYLGTEISYSCAVTSTKPEEGGTHTSFELAPGITPLLRLGWQF